MITGNRQQAAGNSKKLKLVVCALCVVLFALCAHGDAQQPTKKIPRIVLTRPERSGDPGGQVNVAAFLQGMGELGYTEGNNFIVEILWLELQPERGSRAHRRSGSPERRH